MPEKTLTDVRAARTRAGLRQADLATAVGVSRQTIVSLERGDYSPSVYLALRIARTLGSTVEELFPLPEEN
ncbi:MULTISPECIES: helix-turn-helix transcriptional regulator [unclassified Gordonia (in: high G+C Gram-positive bacteria)]|uniref:helix-turn-helix transcriptional regulator n=2 Tax=Gordonia TaxID=2053 RepID=UPI001FFF7E78|nr:helix-turn-helix transcriptional regulator [Gordonia sp. PP30]UQE76051.1 helix-turn-helix transcriptional regulator [Gordonia sp. PP30]